MTRPSAAAYHPLRPRGLLLQAGVLVVAETILFLGYRGQEAGFHWATHFLAAMTAWALVNALWLALKGSPARAQVLSLLAWHLLAMFPDLLFTPGHIPHDDWMDVFLAHISAHDVPGGLRTWLVTALATSGFSAFLLGRWLAARHAEVSAGMDPGVGMGGTHLLRPQRPPASTLLAHRRFGPEGPPLIVLLHGLGTSAALWTPVAEGLARRGMAVLVPDLLGFGGSRRIGTAFGLGPQAAALARLLEATKTRGAVLVGHSFGCAVAVGLVRKRPEQVNALALVAPPAFGDPARARRRLARRGWLARKFLDGAPTASAICNVMCLTRTAIGAAPVRMAPHLPEAVGRGSVQHTWPAYRDSLAALLSENPLPEAIARPRVPTTVVAGDRDELAPLEDVLEGRHDAVRLEVWPGDHLLPLHCSERLAQLISDLAEEVAGAR